MKKSLVVLCFLIAGFMVAGCNGDGSDPEIQTYEFTVEHDGVANVVWCYDDDCDEEVSNGSPWVKEYEKRIDIQGEAKSMFISAQILGTGTVTSRLFIDETMKDENTATGSYVYSTASWEK
jgi:hypothetical protein